MSLGTRRGRMRTLGMESPGEPTCACGRINSCLICSRAYKRRWRLANLEKDRECKRKWAAKAYAANPEKYRAISLKFRHSNLEGRREYDRQRRKSHPEIHRLAEQKRHATKKLALGTGVSRSEWAAIVKKQKGRCPRCGENAPLCIDHVVPLARGGAHAAFNVQGLCRPCNSSKNAKLLPGVQHTLFDKGQIQ